MVKDLTKGSPLKLMLYFAIPLFIGNLFQQLYTMTDTSIVGKALGKDALAAVGATGPLHWVVFSFFNGLNNGITVVTGQCFGAKDMKNMRRSITTGLAMSSLLTILAGIVLCMFMPQCLRLLKMPDELLPMSLSYSYILYGFMIVMIVHEMFCSICRALGDTMTPLIFLIVACLLNVGLDLFFIMVLGWGVAGAAWATIISQFVAFAGTVFYMYKKFPILRMEPGDWRFRWDLCRRELKIALPIALQFLITSSGGVVLGIVLNGEGATYIAASSIAGKIDCFAILPIMSFGVALTAFSAQNFGAKNYARVRQGVTATTKLLLPFCIIAAIILHFGAPYFSLLFVNKDETVVIEAVQKFVDCACLFMWILGLLHVYRHVQQGVGKSYIPMMAGFAEVACRLFASLVLFKSIGILGLCLANPLAWLGATIVLFFGYIRTDRFLKRLINDQRNEQSLKGALADAP